MRAHTLKSSLFLKSLGLQEPAGKTRDLNSFMDSGDIGCAVHVSSLCACMHVPNVIPKGSYCVHLVVTKQVLKGHRKVYK